jgi:hypothetical protein
MVATMFLLLALAAMASTPVASAPGDEPGTGPWVEHGTVVRDKVRLSADDPSADPVDWYRINLTAGPSSLDLLRIDVNLTRNGGDQFLVWASVHDPDGALLTEVRSTNYVIKSTSTLCHRTGVYLIRVYTYSYLDCHYRIEFNVSARANVTDGDDTLGEATFLEPPADVTGHLHGVLDPFDHYAVNLTRDDTHYEFVQVRLSLDGVPVGRTDLDLFLIVYDHQGLPREVSSSTSNGSSEMAFFAATLEPTTVYIRCHAYGGNTSYALNVTKVKVTDDGNNNILRSVELDAGSSTSDSLNLTDRLDYFKVNLSGGDRMLVETETHGWDAGTRKPDLNIYLYSPNGLIINWSHSYDPHERARVEAPVGDPPAFYYILVTFFDRNPADGIPAWGNYTINITVDRAPRLVADLPLEIPEDDMREMPLAELVEDPDGEVENVMVLPSEHIYATYSGELFRFIPNVNFTGQDNVTLLVSSNGREVELRVPVNVTPVPDAPGLSYGFEPVEVDEDGQVTVDLDGIIVDADGDAFTLSPLWDDEHPLGGSTLTGHSLTVVPEADVFGNFTLPLQAEDDTGMSATILLPVVVVAMPDPPLAILPEANITIDEDQLGVEFDLATMFVDPDGRALSYRVTGGTGSILFIVIDDVLVMDAAPDYHGVAVLTIEALAGDQGATAVLTVTILSVVDPPLVTGASPDTDVDLTEGGAQTFTVTAEDPEGGTLAYSWYLDGVQVADEALPRFELVTNSSSQGEHLVTARVSNGLAETFHNWSVSVENVNQPPVLVLRRPRAGEDFEEGTNVVFEAEATDPDGETLSVQWLEDGKVLGTGSSFATSKLETGKHTVTARVVDPSGAATEANVTFTVEEAGGLPGACGPAAVVAVLLGGVMAAVWHRSRKL